MTTWSGSTRYIQNGRISRSASPKFRVLWIRLVLIFSVLLALIVTNPANKLDNWIPNRDTSKQKQGSFLFSIPLFRSQQSNFGLFALSRSIDGISIVALQTTIPLCDFDSPEDDGLLNPFCDWIDDSFCHGKQLLDWNDLPYTLNRLLCWAILCIRIFPFFIDHSEPSRSRTLSSVSALFPSVLVRPTLWDVIRTNLIVYPALVSMDRLIRSYLVIDGYRWHFIVSSFVLVIAIGAICNQIAGAFQREPMSGMRATFAACLGYYRAVGTKSSSLFKLVDLPFSASSVFWLDASLLFLEGQSAQLVALLVGGMCGHAFGLLHRQWLAEALYSKIESSLERGLHQLLAPFIR